MPHLIVHHLISSPEHELICLIEVTRIVISLPVLSGKVFTQLYNAPAVLSTFPVLHQLLGRSDRAIYISIILVVRSKHC